MPTTETTTTAATLPPAFASIADFSAMTGLGRSKVYELLGEGHLRAVKSGRSTLLDVQHGLAYLRALPPADIRPTYRRRAA